MNLEGALVYVLFFLTLSYGAQINQFYHRTLLLPNAIFTDFSNSIWFTTTTHKIVNFKNIDNYSVIDSNEAPVLKKKLNKVGLVNNDEWLFQREFGYPPIIVFPNDMWNYKEVTWDEMNSNSSLLKDSIISINGNSKGEVWVSTIHHGLFRYKDDVWTNFDTSNTIMDAQFYQNPTFRNNEVWFNGRHDKYGGVLRFDGVSRWNKWDSSNSILPCNVINQMVVGKGTICYFIGNNGTLTSFDGVSNWHVFDTSTSGDSLYFRGINLDNDSTVWFYSKKGIGKIIDNDAIWVDTSALVFNSRGIVFDHNNIGWITFDSNIVVKYANGLLKKYDLSENDSKIKKLSHMFISSNNDVWATLHYGYEIVGSTIVNNEDQILHIHNDTVDIITPYNTSLANDTTTALTTTRSNTLYIATNYGISQFRDKKWNAWPDSVVGIDHVTSLLSDHNGTVWGGSSNWQSDGGLVQFDGVRWTKFTMDNSELPSPEIFDLAEDSAGVLWISHKEGISSFDGSNWKHFKSGDLFPSIIAMGGIAFDRSGDLWVATSKGAYKYDGSSWTVYDSTSGAIPRNYLNDVTVDTAGDVWFGSLNGGIFQYNGSSWVVHESALPTNDIRIVQADSFGNIWAGSNKGISKWNGTTWSVIDSTNSELQSNQISSIAIGADGSKWFGTAHNGIAQLVDDDSLTVGIKPSSLAKASSPMQVRMNNGSIVLSGVSGSVNLNLYDLRGRIVFRQNWENLTGSASAVPAIGRGVYVARVQAADRVISSRVFW